MLKKIKTIIVTLAIMMTPMMALVHYSPAFAIDFDGEGLDEDGTFHIYMAPPTSMDEKYRLNEKIDELAPGYGITTGGEWGCNEGFTACRLAYHGEGWTEEEYSITYIYDEDALAKINEIMADFELPEDGFLVHDTELVKYWVFGGASLGEISNEVKTALQNVNLEFHFEERGGGAAPLESHNIGTAEIIYQGTIYKVIGGMPGPKVVAPHIFYVPTGTADEDKGDALIERFVAIYGEDVRDVVSVLLTDDTANDLMDEGYYEAPELFDDYLDETVYEMNIDFGGLGDSFSIIIVADSEKMNEGFGVDSTDLLTDVNIKTDAVNLPGDASTYAYAIGDDMGEVAESIEEKLGTFYAYELGLFSKAVDEEIGDNNGEEFIVSVPVPESLAGIDKLSAYWINFETEEPEEHYAEIVNGFAVFSTDHFSTYILAASSEDRPDDEAAPKVPDTGFASELSEGLAAVPMFGLTAVCFAGLMLRRRKE